MAGLTEIYVKRIDPEADFVGISLEIFELSEMISIVSDVVRIDDYENLSITIPDEEYQGIVIKMLEQLSGLFEIEKVEGKTITVKVIDPDRTVDAYLNFVIMSSKILKFDEYYLPIREAVVLSAKPYGLKIGKMLGFDNIENLLAITIADEELMGIVIGLLGTISSIEVLEIPN